MNDPPVKQFTRQSHGGKSDTATRDIDLPYGTSYCQSGPQSPGYGPPVVTVVSRAAREERPLWRLPVAGYGAMPYLVGDRDEPWEGGGAGRGGLSF